MLSYLYNHLWGCLCISALNLSVKMFFHSSVSPQDLSAIRGHRDPLFFQVIMTFSVSFKVFSTSASYSVTVIGEDQTCVSGKSLSSRSLPLFHNTEFIDPLCIWTVCGVENTTFTFKNNTLAVGKSLMKNSQERMLFSPLLIKNYEVCFVLRKKKLFNQAFVKDIFNFALWKHFLGFTHDFFSCFLTLKTGFYLHFQLSSCIECVGRFFWYRTSLCRWLLIFTEVIMW